MRIVLLIMLSLGIWNLSIGNPAKHAAIQRSSSNSDTVILWVDTVDACSGNQLNVALRVKNFNSIGGLSLKLWYGSPDITFDGVQYIDPQLDMYAFNDSAVEPGWRKFMIAAITLDTINIPDNGILLQLKFNYASDSTVLKFETWNYGNCGIYNVNATISPTIFLPGYIFGAVLPPVPGEINGADTVVKDGISHFSIQPVLPADSYVWTLPAGASIINGAGTAAIDVYFSDSAQAGQILVYGVNACGNGDSASKYLNVECSAIPPYSQTYLHCGPGAIWLYGMGGANYLWYDQAAGGTPIASGASFLTPLLTVTDTFYVSEFEVCESKRVPVIVVINNSYVEGRLSYANTSQSDLDGFKVFLETIGGSIIDSTLTDTAGDFRFCYLPAGTYKTRIISAKPAGGMGAVDALSILRHMVGLQSLNGIYLKAADANHNGFINSLDALFVHYRFVGIIPNFPGGDWVYDDPLINYSGAGPMVVNINGLCVGDVDGSYSPP